MKQLILTLLLIPAVALTSAGQPTEETTEGFSRWRAVLMMANSHIPKATEGGQVLEVIPTWGLDLDYRINPLWSIALQTDMKISSFEVEEHGTELARSFPITVAIVPHFYLPKHWSFMLGPGYEFEKTKNIFLVKAGLEYGFKLTERFELGITAIYENRWEVYDGYTFGASFIFLLDPKKPAR